MSRTAHLKALGLFKNCFYSPFDSGGRAACCGELLQGVPAAAAPPTWRLRHTVCPSCRPPLLIQVCGKQLVANTAHDEF